MELYALVAIPIGYLLGSAPSAYIIGRLIGKTDMRTEGDGRISAAAIKKRVGFWPFILVVVMDVSKGVIAIVIARLLVNSPMLEEIVILPLIPLLLVLATGFVAVIGHSWSPFLGFRGGLGATVIYGVLAGVSIFPQEITALVIGGITVLITRKSGFSTGIIIAALVIIFLLQKLFWSPEMSPILVAYPVILILIMMAKRFQLNKTRGTKSHDLLEYWKNNQ
jgi:glycerol-3-phosphate acyltransferase PlsY